MARGILVVAVGDCRLLNIRSQSKPILFLRLCAIRPLRIVDIRCRQDGKRIDRWTERASETTSRGSVGSRYRARGQARNLNLEVCLHLTSF